MGTSSDEKPLEASTSEATSAPREELQWNAENEVHLFHAMIGNKPAGINKHFNMAFICEKLSKMTRKEVSSDRVWQYLDGLYNLEMLDEIEGITFPNEVKDFSLPESEYGAMMKNKAKEIVPKAEITEDPVRVRSISRGSGAKETTTKLSKKEQLSAKSNTHQNVETLPSSSSAGTTQALSESIQTPSKTTEKDSAKPDPRRDSKDSNSSSKEVKTPSGAAAKTPALKEGKISKAKRSSIIEKSEESPKPPEDPSSNKKGSKRSTRGSLKPEEPTPPSRRRRI